VVVAGSIAKQFLATKGISILAYVEQISSISEEEDFSVEINYENIEKSLVRCPYPDASDRMIAHLVKLKEEGDTAGGIIHCIIKGCEPGLGDPIFDKLSAKLAHAMFSIHSVRSFGFGMGFASAELEGSDTRDEFGIKNGRIETLYNTSGGIQGGISNGMDIEFEVVFKAISSIPQPQRTVNRQAEEVEFTIEGRHDVCIVPRAVPIVEAMAALVIADGYLKNLPYAEKL
jgi:chorismate synthase